MLMRRYLLGIGMCLALCAGSSAQHARRAKANPEPDGPASKEDVEKYFTVMNIRENMAIMLDSMAKQSYQMAHEEIEKSGAKLPPDFEERVDKLMDNMMKGFPIDELTDAIVPVIQRHLTRNELKAVTAFYATPAGQKLLKEQPAITQESMQAAYGVMGKRMETMRDQVQTEIGLSRLDTKPPAAAAPAKPN
jgi:hypothetical protein